MKQLINPLLITLTCCSVGVIAQPSRADKAGEALLQRAITSTARLNSIEFEVEVNTKDRGKNLSRTADISLKRPNFAKVISSGTEAAMKTTVYSDGKQLTTFFRDNNQFLHDSVDMNGGNIFAVGPIEAAVFFNPDLLNRLPLMGKGVKRVGTQRVNGISCDVLKVVGAPSGHAVTIYVGPDGLLRGVTTLNSNVLQESRVKKLLVNKVFARTLFTWNPPAGVKPYDPKSSEVLIPARSADDDNGLLKVGSKAPDLLVHTLDGSKVQLASLFKQNKATLVNFWFVGCPPCREELPHLNKMYLDLKSKGFSIVAVNVQDEKPEIAKFWKKSKFSIPAGLDGGAIAQKYQVSATPTNYVVGSDGRILASFLGFDEQGIRTAVEHAGIK